MSLGFRAQSEPVPPRDVLLWRVIKAGRTAHAVVRLLSTGRALRVYVGQDLGWSRLFRDYENGRVLSKMADGCLADFLRLGWARDLPA